MTRQKASARRAIPASIKLVPDETLSKEIDAACRKLAEELNGEPTTATSFTRQCLLHMLAKIHANPDEAIIDLLRDVGQKKRRPKRETAGHA